MATVKVDNNLQILSPNTKLTAVRVTDIILDPSHDRFEDYGQYDSIGTIFYTENLNKSNPNTDSTARPLFSFVKNYPLINEIVLIMSSGDKDNKISKYYFPIVNIWNHPHHNALPYLEQFGASSNDYEQNIARQVEDGSTNINLGNYFQEKLNIKPLLPYEGDTIIEGRFGNSIRFGSTNISDKIDTFNEWSNTGELGDPITIIRNGQSDQLDDKGWIHNIEDVSNDASSIYMTSNQQLSNFKVVAPLDPELNSFGANLVTEPTVQEQLTGDYKTPQTQTTQIEFPTEDIPTEDISNNDTTEEFFETSPNNPPVQLSTEPNDPFADYAEELLDGPGNMEVINISGTEDEDKGSPSINDSEYLSENKPVSRNEINFNIPIPSYQYEGISCTVHTPLMVSEFIKKLETETIEPAERVKYLVIHTTASPLTFKVSPHLAMAHYFMQQSADEYYPKGHPKEGQLKKKVGGWRKHGYHITIDYEGTCVRLINDNQSSNGINGAGKGNNMSSNIGNNDVINVSWIGGYGIFDMTNKQANSLNEIVKYYILKYPKIKILGHNQIARKDCPWFNVPLYCEKLKISNKNIYRNIPSNLDLSNYEDNHIKVAKLKLS